MRTIRVQIYKPVFMGGSPQIGIAEYKLSGVDMVEVEIGYVRKSDGQKSWPGVYKMTVQKLKSFPSQVLKAGVKVFRAPIGEWDHEY